MQPFTARCLGRKLCHSFMIFSARHLRLMAIYFFSEHRLSWVDKCEILPVGIPVADSDQVFPNITLQSPRLQLVTLYSSRLSTLACIFLLDTAPGGQTCLITEGITLAITAQSKYKRIQVIESLLSRLTKQFFRIIYFQHCFVINFNSGKKFLCRVCSYYLNAMAFVIPTNFLHLAVLSVRLVELVPWEICLH